MSVLDDFVKSPSWEVFNSFTKDQLQSLADHFGIALTPADKRAKDLMRVVIKAALLEKEVLPAGAESPGDLPPAGLTEHSHASVGMPGYIQQSLS